MKKLIAALLVLLSLLALPSCSGESAILDRSKTYAVSSGIHSLDVQVNAVDFSIQYDDQFRIESNLKNLQISEDDGVLKIIDKSQPNANYTDATLKLYVPEDLVFDRIEIVTGAARLTSVPLSASFVELKLGAGRVVLEGLNASSAIRIEGGAGEIIIRSGTLNNLTLMMGVGKMNMTAALLGENLLKFGVGESNLTLIGSKEDYRLEIEKGFGSITVDGKEVTDFGSSGSGQSHIQIEGGVGAGNITFREG